MSQADFDILIAEGNTGFYSRAEVTSIYLIEKSTGNAINYFTLAVFEEDEIPNPSFKFITPELVEVDKTYSLGIARHYETIDSMRHYHEELMKSSSWVYNGKVLALGKLISIPKQFIPADGSRPVPINSILKNPYNRSSYIVEFFDIDKNLLGSYAKDIKIIARIQDIIKGYLQVDLLFVMDRIGNIIFQFPITLLSTKKRSLKTLDGIKFEIAWHPNLITPPDVQMLSSTEIDREILGFGTIYPVIGLDTLLKTGNSDYEETSFIFNPKTQIILDMSTNFYVKNIAININAIGNDREPRTLTAELTDGSRGLMSFSLNEKPEAHGQPNRDYLNVIRERVYEGERRKLRGTLEFVQYGIAKSERAKALAEIRKLISWHGQNGIYLWDPYLNAYDLLDTLYFSAVSGSSLRAICNYSGQVYDVLHHEYLSAVSFPDSIIKEEFDKYLNEVTDKDYLSFYKSAYEYNIENGCYLRKDGINHDQLAEFRFRGWKLAQEKIFLSASNNRGINLEYRCQHGQFGQYGPHGWPFHDRFLLFPMDGFRPKVWSLGTSVNSLGKEHHILQAVSNAQLVIDAFEELWYKLAYPCCLVWRYMP